MTRARRPDDWKHDRAAGRPDELEVAKALSASRRISGLEDHTTSMTALDFCFQYRGETRWVDAKGKMQTYSRGISGLWRDVPEPALFVLDETVYRRIVWQGGGGYLVVHDHPNSRWVYYGPWELTLGPRVRYGRREFKQTEFIKGKILLDLRIGETTSELDIDALLSTIDHAETVLGQVDSAVFPGIEVPTLGT